VTVVDASVVVDWVAPGIEEGSPALVTLRRLAEERHDITAPRLLVEEVANALLTGVRRRRWSGRQADEAFARLRRLPVRLVDDRRDLDRAWDLARRYDNHPLYDMLYVALAERTQSVLLTADDSLRSRLSSLAWVLGPDPGPD
jgi:predicted nucleic acid-binding protein